MPGGDIFKGGLTLAARGIRCIVADVLPDAEIKNALKELPGWSWEKNALVKSFQFGSFREAMSFMVRVAFEAEAIDHHPEWTNVYDRVSIRLNTHDAGGRVTKKDVELAQRIEAVTWV